MEDTELSLYDLFALILRKWRGIVIFALVVAIIAGIAGGVALRLYQMHDEEKIAEWQEEYEAAYGSYHATLKDLDRQIDEHNRAILKSETRLNELDRQISIHQNSIEKYKDNIQKYEARIADYEADILILEDEIVKQEYLLNYQEEQNENSLYMAIDPYDVKTFESYIRIDAGYQIIPNATYQDTNPTNEILNTYIMLVNNTAFYERMIKDLGLDTEVRYLTEVVSVSTYNSNSLRVRVIGADASVVEKISAYICAEILDNHEAVARSVKEHDIALYNERSFSSIDVNIYTRQQDNLKKVSNYNETIRSLNMNILNLNTSIRDLNTDIFNAEVRIEEINEAINLIPAEVEAVNATIAKHEDDQFVLRNDKVEFMEEEKEPVYAGYTYFSLLTGFAKFAIIGGVLAGVIAVVYVVVIALMGGKVLSADMICAYSKTNFFGVWPSDKKKPFAFVDKWVDAILGVSTKKSVDEVAAVVLSNLAVSTEGQSEVLLCGGANEETLEEIKAKISAKCPNVKFIIGGTIGEDSRTIEGLASCSAVVIVEERYVSDMKSVQELKKRAASMDKPILGVIII